MKISLVLLASAIALTAPAAQASTCKLAALPDHACTPGAAMTADQARICPAARNLAVPKRTKAKVLRAYRVSKRSQRRYVVAPLIPFALGGSNRQANLFPQTRANAAKLMRLGTALHSAVCGLEIGLGQAQALVASDWTAAYAKFYR